MNWWEDISCPHCGPYGPCPGHEREREEANWQAPERAPITDAELDDWAREYNRPEFNPDAE
jgi:hypothetical protein